MLRKIRPIIYSAVAVATTLQLSTPAFAQLGQSNWVSPSGGSSGSSSGVVHLFKKKSQVAPSSGGIGQSDWVPASGGSLDSGGGVMLNGGGATSEPLSGNVQYNTGVQQPAGYAAGYNNMQGVNGMQTGTGGFQPAGYAAGYSNMQGMNGMQTGTGGFQPAGYAAGYSNVQGMNGMQTVQPMQPMNGYSNMQSMNGMQTGTGVQQPAGYASGYNNTQPMQGVNWSAVGASSAPAPVQSPIPTSTHDDSLAAVVLGAPSGSSGAASGAPSSLGNVSSNLNNALTTAATIGLIGSSLGSTVGPMLQGFGFDNHFHTYGAATGGTFYADGYNPNRGYLGSSGSGLLGSVGGAFSQALGDSLNRGAMLSNYALMQATVNRPQPRH